jgi:hypothetical protein
MPCVNSRFDIKWSRRAAALSARPGTDCAAKRSARQFVRVTEETGLFAQRRGARGEKLLSSSLSAPFAPLREYSCSERFYAAGTLHSLIGTIRRNLSCTLRRQRRDRLRKPAKEAGTNLENESKNPDKSGKIRRNPGKSG